MQTASEQPKPEHAISVLVVDDSAVIRGLISRKLSDVEDMHVVCTAVNGRDAITKLERHPEIEVVILDIEMPEMDGLAALPELIKLQPDVKILMASTLTQRNADISMQAMSLGAADYLPKPTMQERDSLGGFYKELTLKVRALGQATKLSRGQTVRTAPAAEKKQEPLVHKADDVKPNLKADMRIQPSAIAIASSTGGPQALNELFKLLQGTYSDIPIFITQHMPPTFTTLLAKNIGKEGNRTVKEAEQGEKVEAGVTYVAPGDYHMTFKRGVGEIVVELDQSAPINFCRPAADPMISSLSDLYGKELLVIVLTGMGHDGREGAIKASELGATVIAQDEESSVVWGMPGAVANAHICSKIAPVKDLADYVKGLRGL